MIASKLLLIFSGLWGNGSATYERMRSQHQYKVIAQSHARRRGQYNTLLNSWIKHKVLILYKLQNKRKGIQSIKMKELLKPEPMYIIFISVGKQRVFNEA